MPKMIRTTITTGDEEKRKAMSLAAMRGEFYFSEVMREALALWIAREEMREEIHKWLEAYENDRDEPTLEFAEILDKLMGAGQK